MKATNIAIVLLGLCGSAGAAHAGVSFNLSVRSGGGGRAVEHACGGVAGFGFGGTELTFHLTTTGKARKSNALGIRSMRLRVEAGGGGFYTYDADCNPRGGGEIVDASVELDVETTDGERIRERSCGSVGPDGESVYDNTRSCPLSWLKFQNNKVFFTRHFVLPTGDVIDAEIVVTGVGQPRQKVHSVLNPAHLLTHVMQDVDFGTSLFPPSDFVGKVIVPLEALEEAPLFKTALNLRHDAFEGVSRGSFRVNGVDIIPPNAVIFSEYGLVENIGVRLHIDDDGTWTQTDGPYEFPLP
jgi:hypothetical protein